DSCPMEGFDAAQYSQILQLPENLVPTCVVPVGYAADEQREKLRFSKEEVFF
ncbi:NAD(P)H-dependent oxidoreductase, partial [Candidatus Micrarchaeota archaeon CG10_big_fil_rev_8_21_14_0_10_45_29]